MSEDRTPRRATCRYHCTSCDQHFSSLVAFDAHRIGPWEERECVLPHEAVSERGKTLLRVQTTDGICRLQPPGERDPVEIVEAT